MRRHGAYRTYNARRADCSPARSPVTYPVSTRRAPEAPRQSARTACHAPRGVVGKLFVGIISYSAHTALTLSARSQQQRQRWRGWGAFRPRAFTHVRSFPGLGVRRVLEGFRSLGLGWDGGSLPGLPSGSPRRATRALRSPAISHSTWSAPRPARRAGTPVAPQPP